MKACLIVDDSRVVRSVARGIVRQLGFETAEAADGAAALEACEARMPDVVLLDWNMPVMNGLEFLHALRARPDGGRPKVVFCTSENELPHIEQALAAGADEYIMKPFDKDIVETKFTLVGVL
ncbi:MAG: response regulator [Rhodospirillales bacterium]|nr:MAG: response regulator [Rhodospirillales bacterium]